MEIREKSATWLELAVAPVWRRDKFVVKMHRLLERDEACFVLSVDERWLCSGEGKLTVFRSEAAVDRFLELLGVGSRQNGEPLSDVPDEACGRHCLQMRGEHLAYCVFNDPLAAVEVPGRPRRRHRIQSVPARACFISDSIWRS